MRARITSAGPRGRVEVNSEGGADALPDGTSSRNGQERVYVDRVRGGDITAEMMHDWDQQRSTAGSDLITAVSKKAAVPMGAWDVIDLEPECTLFSTASIQNISKGCTRGKYLGI